jgi:hypothetical protein
MIALEKDGLVAREWGVDLEARTQAAMEAKRVAAAPPDGAKAVRSMGC